MKVSVAVLGTGMTPQGKAPTGPDALAGDAAARALADGGIKSAHIELVVVANALGGVPDRRAPLRSQAWLLAIGLGQAPVLNVDNGCASGASALHAACLAVTAGISPVLVVGVEKMWTGDRAATLAGVDGCVVGREPPALPAELVGVSRSLVMAIHAVWANHQIEQRATTPAHFAAAAAKARRHASANPLAQYRAPVTEGEVLRSPPVAGTLTRLMCCPVTDGAAALVLAGGPARGSPRVVASVLASGDGTSEYHERMGDAAGLACEEAAIGLGDIDVVELHDATAAEELYALEAIGFFGTGEAGPATAEGATALGTPGLVVNPSGGLVARGHPLGSTGICQVVELSEQLRGRSDARQVERALVGMAVNTGGIVGWDTASVGVHLLVRGR